MALGDISPFGSAVEFDTHCGVYISLLEARPGIFIVIYQGYNDEGWVKSFTCDADGNISPIIDSLQFDIRDTRGMSACLVGEGIVAVSYANTNDDLIVTTFSVTPEGHISDAIIDRLNTDLVSYGWTSIVNCGFNDVFACCHTTVDYDPQLVTFVIEPSGHTPGAYRDAYTYIPSYYGYSSLVRRDEHYYVALDNGSTNLVTVTTFRIDDDGSIDRPRIDQKELAAGYPSLRQIWQVDIPMFACIYNAEEIKGEIGTIGISRLGVIDGEFTNTFTFPEIDFKYPKVVHVGGSCYAICHTSSTNVGWVRTISISATGSIGDSFIDVESFGNISVCFPDIIHISGDTFLVAYADTTRHGQLRSCGIASTSGGPGLHLPLMGIG